MRTAEGCRGCGRKTTQAETKVARVYECGHCGAIWGECYIGESYEMVRPYMTTINFDPADTRYYDMTTIGSEGLRRRHGWFEPTSRLITQVG